MSGAEKPASIGVSLLFFSLFLFPQRQFSVKVSRSDLDLCWDTQSIFDGKKQERFRWRARALLLLLARFRAALLQTNFKSVVRTYKYISLR